MVCCCCAYCTKVAAVWIVGLKKTVGITVPKRLAGSLRAVSPGASRSHSWRSIILPVIVNYTINFRNVSTATFNLSLSKYRIPFCLAFFIMLIGISVLLGDVISI